MRHRLAAGPLTGQVLRLLQEYFVACAHLDRIDLAGLKPDRMDMMCGGGALLSGFLEAFDTVERVPTPAGLRIGVLWDLHLHGKPCNLRDENIAAFAQRFQASGGKGRQAAELACSMATSLFDALESSQSQ